MSEVPIPEDEWAISLLLFHKSWIDRRLFLFFCLHLMIYENFSTFKVTLPKYELTSELIFEISVIWFKAVDLLVLFIAI